MTICAKFDGRDVGECTRGQACICKKEIAGRFGAVLEGWVYEMQVVGGTYRTFFSCEKPEGANKVNIRKVYS